LLPLVPGKRDGMLTSIIKGAAAGVAAGAAGTTALNAVTYADMSIRGRPSSDAPAQVVQRAAEQAGIAIPGHDEARGNRLSGLGALSGIGTGVTVGAACGVAWALGWRIPWPAAALATAAAAMAGSDGPLFLLGVSDPRKWGALDWASDVVPHAAYGMVTAATLAALYRQHGGGARTRRK
jgi:hypothetical protein